MSSLVAAFIVGLFVQAPSALPASSPAMTLPMEGAPMAESKDGPWKPYDYGSPEQRRHSVSSGTLVVIAFGLIWLVLLLYVGVLASRQRRLRSEMGALPSGSPTDGSTDARQESPAREMDQ